MWECPMKGSWFRVWLTTNSSWKKRGKCWRLQLRHLSKTIRMTMKMTLIRKVMEQLKTSSTKVDGPTKNTVASSKLSKCMEKVGTRSSATSAPAPVHKPAPTLKNSSTSFTAGIRTPSISKKRPPSAAINQNHKNQRRPRKWWQSDLKLHPLKSASEKISIQRRHPLQG